MVEEKQQYDFGSDGEDKPVEPDIIIGISVVNINYDKTRKAIGSEEDKSNEFADMPQVEIDAINIKKAFMGFGIKPENIKEYKDVDWE